MRAGDVDAILCGLEAARSLKADGFEILESPRARDFAMLGYLRTENPDLPYTTAKPSGLLVRKALALAVDRNAIWQQVLGGVGEAMGAFQPMYSRSVEYDAARYPVVPFDPDQAIKLLSEAGYANGFGIDIYSFVGSSPEQPMVDEALAGYWEAVGLKPRILTMDFPAFRQIWVRQKEPDGAAAFNYVGGSRIGSSYRALLSSEGFFSNQKVPEIDAMLDKLDEQTTIEAYAEKAREILDWQYQNYMSFGYATVPATIALRQGIPGWNIGKLYTQFRYEHNCATCTLP